MTFLNMLQGARRSSTPAPAPASAPSEPEAAPGPASTGPSPMEVDPGASTAPQDFELGVAAERDAVSAAEEAKLLAMLSIKAPEVLDESRTATSLTVAADVSGSMRGDKIELMKQTLRFVVEKGLTAIDSFGLVSFHSEVKVELPVTRMDAAGKRAALQAIEALQVRGATNLSGGLLQAIDLHAQAAIGMQPQGDNRAVFLFTDGMANGGLQTTPEIVTAVQGVAASMPSPPSCFTFGFGRDHNEEMLRGIADAAGGMYYFVADKESIPVAFGDALGGLISVVAQNVSLTLRAQAGAAIDAVLSQGYATTLSPDGTQAMLQIGDLYSEDEKDILVRLTLPKAAAPGIASSVACELRGFDVRGSSIFTRNSTITVERPETAPAKQAVNLKIDEQRNRIEVAEAMKQAAALADEGSLEEGRELLRKAQATLDASPTAASPFCQALKGEVVRLEEGYADRASYAQFGGKMSKMTADCYMQQRSNHVSAAVFEKKGKRNMKAKFM